MPQESSEAKLQPGQAADVEALLGPYDHRHPYYIVAPKYVGTSAGIRALYMLCRALNSRGESAYMVDIGLGGPPGPFIGPDLAVPQISESMAKTHTHRGRVPIVVYPETIRGNPLDATCPVRYILNYPGLLGGPDQFNPDEMLWAYSGVLGRAAGTANVMCIPASDPRIWTPDPTVQERDLRLVYAPKLRMLGGQVADHGRVIEIQRGVPSRPALRELLRRAEVIYVYENSAIAIEAMLTGCPVIFMENEHFTEPILGDELGWNGMVWGDFPGAIGQARESIPEGRRRYLELFAAFGKQLDLFVESTQLAADASAPPLYHYSNTTAIVDNEVLNAILVSRTWRYTNWTRSASYRLRQQREAKKSTSQIIRPARNR